MDAPADSNPSPPAAGPEVAPATDTADAKARTPSDQKVASAGEEKAALPSDQKAASTGEEKAAPPSEQKVAPTGEEKAAPPSEQKAAPEEPPCLGKTDIYVAADSGGFVGAYYTEADLRKEVAAQYPASEFVAYHFRLNPAQPAREVYILPYQAGDAIAFVTNDEAHCRKVHAALARVGLTYEDDISYWRHPVGRLCFPAKKRLDILARAAREAPSGADDEGAAERLMADFLRRARAEGAPAEEKAAPPGETKRRETEEDGGAPNLLTILDCAEPALLRAADAQTGSPDEKEAPSSTTEARIRAVAQA